MLHRKYFKTFNLIALISNSKWNLSKEWKNHTMFLLSSWLLKSLQMLLCFYFHFYLTFLFRVCFFFFIVCLNTIYKFRVAIDVNAKLKLAITKERYAINPLIQIRLHFICFSFSVQHLLHCLKEPNIVNLLSSYFFFVVLVLLHVLFLIAFVCFNSGL